MPKLIISKLTISSSYVQETEWDSTENNFDTIQWWITDQKAWRIATYSTDNDIRIFSIDKPLSSESALSNTRKHYGDVLEAEYIIDISDPLDRICLEREMEQFGGEISLEYTADKGFGFWNADQRKYKTISEPPGGYRDKDAHR